MGNSCTGEARVKRGGYLPYWERVAAQDDGPDHVCGSFDQAQLDQIPAQDPTNRPFTDREVSLIKAELRSLVMRRIGDNTFDETEIDHLFDQIRDAAITLELALEEERITIAPRHDFRPALRRLKRYPDRLERIFHVDPHETPSGAAQKRRRREDKDLRKLLIFGKTLIDRKLDGDLYTSLRSSPQLRTEIIDALLACTLLADRAGRQPNYAIDEYTEALKSVYTSASGRQAGRSVSNNESRFDDHHVNKSGIPGGPAVRFMQLCLEPFSREINDGVIAELIRKPRRRAKKKKE